MRKKKQKRNKRGVQCTSHHSRNYSRRASDEMLFHSQLATAEPEQAFKRSTGAKIYYTGESGSFDNRSAAAVLATIIILVLISVGSWCSPTILHKTRIMIIVETQLRDVSFFFYYYYYFFLFNERLKFQSSFSFTLVLNLSLL